jgi:DNA polymerase V
MTAWDFLDDDESYSRRVSSNRRVTVFVKGFEINLRKGALRPASVPTQPELGMRREMMSQRYTMRLDQLYRAAF